jgi:hypothetical protein
MADIKILPIQLFAKKEAESNLPEQNLELPAKNIEKIAVPEKKLELAPTMIEKKSETATPTERQEFKPATLPHSIYITQIHLQRQKEIENILASGLEDAYAKMDKETKRKFKATGEQIAREIYNILESTKIKVKKIILLIKKWLLLIPGINIFFLEQEVKIKTDQLLKLKHDREKELK